jgi:hypothetical protein
LIDLRSAREAQWLTDWAFGCNHNALVEESLPFLAQGAEHAVYFDRAKG